MALDEDGKLVRRQDTYCRAHNNTAPNMGPHLRFVPPGRYTLLAWRDLLGWARSEPVVVESGKIADAGRLVFQPGGTIRGRITLPQVSRRPRCVMAVDSHGVRVETESEWTHEGYTFEVKNLWPERWTIMAMDRDENVVTKRTVELNGTEIVETD